MSEYKKNLDWVWPHGEFDFKLWSTWDLNKILCALPIQDLSHLMSDGRKFEIRHQMPKVYCMDGTKLSVQAGEHLYCSPRQNAGPWKTVEVGFPSVEMPESWAQYADATGDDRKIDVYGYVPIEMVMMFIGAHGGIDYKKTFLNFSVGKV